MTSLPNKLATFQAPIRDDLKRFRKQYKETLESGVGLIDRVVAYLTRTHGKGLRPTLTLLCARLGSDTVSEETIRAAVIVELLHEATLVHDDVVDESSERRGMPSLPARFKNKVSVLFGDYMLSRVLTETLSSRDLRWLDVLAETARRMSEGELVQAVRAKRLDLTIDAYLKMIGDKTAALFNACCRLGGLTGRVADELIEPLGTYGDHLGIAFQIKDDLLDMFGNGRIIGKPTGGDLKERKLTLPVLGAMQEASPREVRRIRARVRRGVKRRDIKYITSFVKDYGGDRHAEEIMHRESDRAVSALDNLPPSTIRSTLAELAKFAVNRGN